MVDPSTTHGFQEWNKFEVVGEEGLLIRDICINKEKLDILHWFTRMFDRPVHCRTQGVKCNLILQT